MRDTKSDNGSAGPSRAVTAWTQGLICVAIVACGVIVGGLLHESEPEQTTAPVVVTSRPEPSAPPTYRTVTPPVTYPTQIPGCATVDPPSDGSSFGFVSAGTTGYDDPAYPWFSGPKAVAMSEALHDALPDGVAVGFASFGDSLFFQPIIDATAEHPEFGGFTDAHATLRRGDRAGRLWVSVERSDAPVPPCVAGALDERRLLDDGSTVDTHDTWSETDGVRTLTRRAEAYAPDGTVVTASADDDSTGSVPMSVDELVALVTTPGLRVTATVPPGTPDVSETCATAFGTSVAIDETAATRLDAALAAVSLDGLSFDRPLGALRPGKGGVCQAVAVTQGGQPSRLRVVITAGANLPTAPAESWREDVVDSRQLPDGSAVEDRESSSPEASRVARSVVVTRRSGTSVRVDSTGDDRSALPTFAQLEAIGLAPGLEVSR